MPANDFPRLVGRKGPNFLEQPPTFRVREAIHEPVRFDLIPGMREEPLPALHLLFVQDLDVYEEISIDLHELLVLRQVELRRVGMVSSPP